MRSLATLRPSGSPMFVVWCGGLAGRIVRLRRVDVSKADAGWRGGDLYTWRCNAAGAANSEDAVRRAIDQAAGDDQRAGLLVTVLCDRRDNGFPRNCIRLSGFIHEYGCAAEL
jgi:hypothetical protein